MRWKRIPFNPYLIDYTPHFASEHSKCREKFFHFKETQDLDEVKGGGREIDRSSNVERPSW